METPRVFQATFILLAYVVLGCFAVGAVSQEATLVTYAAPQGADRADDFVVCGCCLAQQGKRKPDK